MSTNPDFKLDANILVELIEKILHTLPEFNRDIVSAGAIPHSFNEEYLTWMLPDSVQKIPEGMNLFKESVSFFSENQQSQYTYHEDVRFSILLNWTRLFPDKDFTALTNRAKEYFKNRYSSQIIESEIYIDYAIELHYLDLMTDTPSGFNSLSEIFINNLNLSKFERCNSILKLIGEPQIKLNQSQRQWVSYFNASLQFVSGDYLHAKQILGDLVENRISDENIRLLALSKRDLAMTIKYISKEWDSVIQLLNDGMKLFEIISDWEGYGSASLQLSIILREQGKPSWEQSRLFAETAIKAFEKANQKYGVAKAQVELGLLYWLNNDFENASRLYKSALSFQEAQKNHMETARVLAFLGRLYRTEGSWDKSEKAFLQSLTILETIGNKHEEAWTLNALGNLYTDMGDFNKAEKILSKGAEIRSLLGQEYEKAVVLKNLIAVYGELSESEKAEDAIRKSLNIFEGMGATQRVGEVLLNAGDVYFKQSDYSKALDAYMKAMSIVEQFDYKDYLPHIKVNIGKILVLQNKKKEASEFLESGLKNSLEKKYWKWAAEASFVLGTLAKEEDEPRKSLLHFSNALNYASDFNSSYAAKLAYNTSLQLMDLDVSDNNVIALRDEIDRKFPKSIE